MQINLDNIKLQNALTLKVERRIVMQKTLLLRTYKEDGLKLIIKDYDLNKLNKEEITQICKNADSIEYVKDYVEM
jgi:hypothetical protein